MIRFECDYTEGALPRIMDLMVRTNMEQTIGYGEDDYCERARELIKKECDAPDADVHFLVGGTQTNKTVIQSVLKSYQGVLSAVSGHINTHETGTIEAGGHKVLGLESDDGKITPRQIRRAVARQGGDIHMVLPAMVYISNPTEVGTMYSKKELTEIKAACDELSLPLFLDGARLGYALAARNNDLTLADYARLCDVFYIGGTKVGALFGEAVVITNPALKKDFRYNIKQNGGLLAKGRLLGLQFMGLFTDGAYYKAGENGIKMAMKIRKAFEEAGIKTAYDSPTNQQFFIMPEDLLKKLEEKYTFSEMEEVPGGRIVRICADWATKEENVDSLIADLKNAIREI